MSRYDPVAREQARSRPGAARTAYLQFTGATLAVTALNADHALPTITATPFSVTPPADTHFSARELAEIQRTWQVTAEDFAPFDLNVTTKPPQPDALERSGPDDQTYGATVLVTQWSLGECPGATNHQDDLAVIATGAPVRADDHGDTAATATTLRPGAPLTGVIAARGDLDAFTFTARGAVRLTASPTSAAPDLDIGLRILDGAGTTVALLDPPVRRSRVSSRAWAPPGRRGSRASPRRTPRWWTVWGAARR
ncbi:hypothetical protein ACT8ZV_10865 [Nocardioides sp. MAHUQ-72]|uniref:hypothetical protein n=1 Tax=unclassified Nocardioides TaxID=2615069 RepID=UPI00361A4C90